MSSPPSETRRDELERRRAVALRERVARLPFTVGSVLPELHPFVFGDFLDAGRLRPKKTARAVAASASEAATAIETVRLLRVAAPESSWSCLSLLRSHRRDVRTLVAASRSPSRLASALDALRGFLDARSRKALMSAVPGLVGLVRETRLARLSTLREVADDPSVVDRYAATRHVGRATRPHMRAYMRGAIDAAVWNERERGVRERGITLTTELNAWGLNLRSDSKLCYAYITGEETMKTPTEIACVMYVCGRLFDIGGHRAYSALHATLTEDALASAEVSPEAIRRLIESRRRDIMDAGYDPYASDADY